MEEQREHCIQEAFKGFLKCLGLDNPPAPLDQPKSTTTYPPVDPLLQVLSSSADNATVATTMDINNNLGGESNFSLVTIDEIINTNGGTTSETHYVDLVEGNETHKNLLTTRLITSGGRGITH